MKYSKRAAPLKFVHVDTAQLEENHELHLSVATHPITNASLGEYYYKPILRGPPLKEVRTLFSLAYIWLGQGHYKHCTSRETNLMLMSENRFRKSSIYLPIKEEIESQLEPEDRILIRRCYREQHFNCKRLCFVVSLRSNCNDKN